MKGYLHIEDFYNKKHLTDILILKALPYGKWTTKYNQEFLFNRDYEPIAGYDLINDLPIPVFPEMWIHDIDFDKTSFFYKSLYPTSKTEVMRDCIKVLADWSKRATQKKIIHD